MGHGPYRQELRSFFAAEIPEELGHAQILADKISALGGTPAAEPAPVRVVAEAKEMLQAALQAEEATLVRYLQRRRQAEEAGEFGLAVQFDDIIPTRPITATSCGRCSRAGPRTAPARELRRRSAHVGAALRAHAGAAAGTAARRACPLTAADPDFAVGALRRLTVDTTLGDLSQQFVGFAFLVQRPLQQVGVLVVAELLCPRARGAVRRDLVMLDPLLRADDEGIDRVRVLDRRQDRLRLLDEGAHRDAAVGRRVLRSLGTLLRELLQPLDVLLRLTAMRLQRVAQLRVLHALDELGHGLQCLLLGVEKELDLLKVE